MDNVSGIEVCSDRRASQATLAVEHEAIEGALTTLQGAVLASANREVIVEILDLAIEYCVSHFANEEAFSTELHHPEWEPHQVAHAKLLERFREAREIAVCSSALATVEAVDLLHDFHQHVETYDKRLHAAIESRRA